MKVLLITESLNSGGAERQLCCLAIMLKDKGYDVKVVTYVEGQFYIPLLEKNNVAYSLNSHLWNKWMRPWRMAKLIRSEKTNVVITFLPMVNMAACLGKPFYKAKLIVGERNTNQGLSKKDRLLFNLYRMADAIVSNSHSQGDFITKHYPNLSKKTYVITNFVDTEKFKPAVIERKDNDVFHIVIVGRYTVQKNILKFLQAVKILKNHHIIIQFSWYGNKKCNGSLFDKAEQLVKEYEIGNIIELNDHTPDVLAIYQQADAFCLPSIYEGFPNVLCEAMSCGLPVVCSNVCDNKDIVEDGINGFLFDPFNSESIANAIEKIISLDTAELKIVGENNRRKIQKICSSEHFINQYSSILRDMN